jgi:ribosomal protection tetracycline resistance protein
MELLVDGYNVMWTFKELNRIARTNFDLARNLLIKLLSVYDKYVEEDIVLVLDGYKGAFPYTRRQSQDGIDIVVTGNGKNADHWIMEKISDEKFEGAVVTSDREIIRKSEKENVPVITAGTFERKVMETVQQETEILNEIHEQSKQHGKSYKGNTTF